MIFVTVGTELPFDRMVGAIDEWARGEGRKDVFAQVGQKAKVPRHIEYAHFLEPTEFTCRFQEADTIVAHAGMGTILSALRYGKPMIVMPRKASLGEQRNEHQMATAKRLMELGKIDVAFDEQELVAKLDQLADLSARSPIGEFASSELIDGLREFFDH